jgi:putative transposase
VRALVETLTRQRRAAYRQVQRAALLLTMAQGVGNNALARTHRLDRAVVRKWRTRWVELARQLAHAEAAEATDAQLHELLVAGLQDAPRSGKPATFSAEQIVQVIALSCEEPQESGRPVTHWTPSELAEEVVKRGIAPTISPTTVGRFLKSDRPGPASHRGLAQRTGTADSGVRRASQNRLRAL